MRRLIIGTAIIVLSPALALLPITHGSRPASAERPQSGSDLQWQLSGYRLRPIWDYQPCCLLTDLGTESVCRSVGTVAVHRTV